jgi:hypothetical protein
MRPGFDPAAFRVMPERAADAFRHRAPILNED